VFRTYQAALRGLGGDTQYAASPILESVKHREQYADNNNDARRRHHLRIADGASSTGMDTDDGDDSYEDGDNDRCDEHDARSAFAALPLRRCSAAPFSAAQLVGVRTVDSLVRLLASALAFVALLVAHSKN